jgi:hypothetical protein
MELYVYWLGLLSPGSFNIERAPLEFVLISVVSFQEATERLEL